MEYTINGMSYSVFHFCTLREIKLTSIFIMQEKEQSNSVIRHIMLNIYINIFALLTTVVNFNGVRCEISAVQDKKFHSCERK